MTEVRQSDQLEAWKVHLADEAAEPLRLVSSKKLNRVSGRDNKASNLSNREAPRYSCRRQINDHAEPGRLRTILRMNCSAVQRRNAATNR